MKAHVKPAALALGLFFFCLGAWSPNPAQAQPNPAARYCQAMGYTYAQGACVFPGGARANAWAFFRGEEAKERSYCARHGMTTAATTRDMGSFQVREAVCAPANRQGREVPMLELMRQNGDMEEFFQTSTRPAPPRQSAVPLKELPARQGLPEAWDWRNHNGHAYIGPVRYQGLCGACYAFGAAAAAESGYNIAHQTTDENAADFSEAFIAWCLGTYGPFSSNFGGCDGADYSYSELLALIQNGVAWESAMPYNGGADPGGCDASAYDTVKSQAWGRVASLDLQGIQTAIATYGVIDVAVLTSSAFQDYAGGIYTDALTDCPDGAYTGTDHAVALVGWGTDPVYGLYWILRNSWGTDWGEGGYMRIQAQAARVACAATWLEAVAAAEDGKPAVVGPALAPTLLKQ